jgi:hypothetical protein
VQYFENCDMVAIRPSLHAFTLCMNTLKLVVWCFLSVQIQLNYLCGYCSWLHLHVREQLKYLNTISLTLAKRVFHFYFQRCGQV